MTLNYIQIIYKNIKLINLQLRSNLPISRNVIHYTLNDMSSNYSNKFGY